jgi:hypothetical protein
MALAISPQILGQKMGGDLGLVPIMGEAAGVELHDSSVVSDGFSVLLGIMRQLERDKKVYLLEIGCQGVLRCTCHVEESVQERVQESAEYDATAAFDGVGDNRGSGHVPRP